MEDSTMNANQACQPKTETRLGVRGSLATSIMTIVLALAVYGPSGVESSF
jgi:hypothetical protein